MSTDEYEAITEAEWKVLATTEITHLTDEEKDYLPRAWDEWIARVRRDAKAEALRNLPPHLSLKVHQCTARESGGGYCKLELSHSCGHRILDVPDGWILGAVDRYINSIEQEPTR